MGEPGLGLSVYNPDLLSKDELLGLFVARRPLLDRLMEDLRRAGTAERPSHHLIVGLRGMGKTTLLRRLRYAISDDAQLSKRWFPLSFPEDQYNVSRLSDLWANCVDALADALHDTDEAEARALDEQVDALPATDEPARAAAALALLTGWAHRKRCRLVLLLDNVDVLLERLKSDHWTIRNVLSEGPFVLIGASAAMIEETYKYDSALYEFFQIDELKSLSEPETRDVLLSLARVRRERGVEEVIQNDRGRLRTLHLLTGGNPRNIVLLFSVLMREDHHDVDRDLTGLLDLCTPLFKARIEELPPQARQMVDALAQHWDPCTAAMVAAEVRLEINVVSAQLDRLAKQGVVEKVPYPGSKTGFQIAERFFNIWYLMRASRRVRRRLLWLVKFLQTFYGSDGLRDKARAFCREPVPFDLMAREHRAHLQLAFAQAVEDSGLKTALETQAVELLMTSREEVRADLSDILDLSGEDAHLADVVGRMKKLKSVRKAIAATAIKDPKWDAGAFWTLLGGSLALSLEEKERIAAGLRTYTPQKRRSIQRSLKKEAEKLLGQGEPWARVVDAVRQGHMGAAWDVDGAAGVAEQSSNPAVLDIAFAAALDRKPDGPALLALMRHLPKIRSGQVWAEWIRHARQQAADPGPFRETVARMSFALATVHELLSSLDREPPDDWNLCISQRAVALFPEDYDALFSLGYCEEKFHEDFVLARPLYRRCTELQPESALAWHKFGYACMRGEAATEEAVSAFRTFVELRPASGDGQWFLGWALENTPGALAEAEATFRRAISLDSDDLNAWESLAGVVGRDAQRNDDFQAIRTEIELRYRKAISERSLDAQLHYSYGAFLENDMSRIQDAVGEWIQAVELNPHHSLALSALAGHFAYGGGDLAKAEQYAKRACQVDPRSPHDALLLARIRVTTKAWASAESSAESALRDVLFTREKRSWPLILDFFAACVQGGYARETVDLIDRLDLAERWQPLREALQSIALKDEPYLLRFALEIRTPAQELVAQLTKA